MVSAQGLHSDLYGVHTGSAQCLHNNLNEAILNSPNSSQPKETWITLENNKMQLIQFILKMYIDVLLNFEFVEIENTKSINDVNYGIYW